MVIDSIKNGIVIDHIKAGLGMKLMSYLNFDNENDTVAIIMNAPSKKRGKKDIIKIENVNSRVVDMDVVGMIDQDATVNIIENEEIKAKLKPTLPKRVEDVIKCKNPRCVTSSERGLKHIFVLNDAERKEYRCIYCDEIVSMDNE